MPHPGSSSVRVLMPTLLELTFINSPEPGATVPDLTNLQPAHVSVTSGARSLEVAQVGFKRRALYAPLQHRDLRVRTDIYVRLRHALPEGGSLEVRIAPGIPEWKLPDTRLTAPISNERLNPAIHVNQEGYWTRAPKLAFIGYFLGSLGELPVEAAGGFRIVEEATGKTVFEGQLRHRRDVGFSAVPTPYQSVYEADFSKLTEPGTYRLTVPSLGRSLPFRIGAGEMMQVARTYALGLYHQRCGMALDFPFTRFGHAACHTLPAAVPLPVQDFSKAWEVLASAAGDRVKPERPELQIRSASGLLFPYVNRGNVDVHGGHHDAGDYSKYVINSASLVHALVFAVDSLPGVAELDNLGLPESGDGISDVLQEAKWESDFISRLQDDDGGFYFLVYPRTRRYENDVPPDRGDRQVVWPKTTASTAAAVAALAQCASSPTFKKHFPAEAKRYFEQARRGWAFLLQAIERHGLDRSYQRLTHYGDDFGHRDELAWAASELFAATGDLEFEKKLVEWYPNPADPATWQWNWRRAAFAYGNALRSYAFAVRSGRLARNQVDAGYLSKCETELRRAADDAVRAADRSAYGVSYPDASKRSQVAGWFFPTDVAFDVTVAYQLRSSPRYEETVFSNLYYELGTNPVNRTFVTGLGLGRQREIVHQQAQNDRQHLPPTGIPIGALVSALQFIDHYRQEIKAQSWPDEDGYPLYDRWIDTYNINTEFVVVNQARSLASVAYWAAQTELKSQPWKGARARIKGPAGDRPLQSSVQFELECESVDLSSARIVWEARDQEPSFGPTFTYTPRSPGLQWVEAEACLPDGRRVFAQHSFRVTTPVVLWVDGALPRGAKPQTRGGDTWDWIKPATKPAEIAPRLERPQHESGLAKGIHDHGFDDAHEVLEVEPGDILFAYIFIDPRNPPKTVMLEWNDGSFDHRAYWGENHIPWGDANTPGQRHMGPLPPSGRWVRLEVPAKAVALEGRKVKGMWFRLFDGRARWDAAGKMTAEGARLTRFPDLRTAESKE